MKPPSTLKTLPPPAISNVGWPWNAAPEPLPPTRPDGAPWPRITIVTPSFNQGRFLEETIRSVLLQGYPHLEYLVIDGGSTDNSAEIIEKYAPWLDYWVSEPDNGQSDAIARGFARADGEIINWLNSDDLYLPGALAAVADAAHAHPGALIAAPVVNFGAGGEELVAQQGITLEHMVQYWHKRYRWHQPGLFLPRDAYEKAGGLDRSLHYVMDHDLACRLLQQDTPVVYLDQPVARFRLHGGSKTCAQSAAMLDELALVSRRYWGAFGRGEDDVEFRCLELVARAFSHLRAGRYARAGRDFVAALRLDMRLATRTALGTGMAQIRLRG